MSLEALAPWLIAVALLGPIVVWPLALVSLLRLMTGVRTLASVEVQPRARWPTLSVVSPACNEEAAIAQSLKSLVSQDYPALEVIAVNDRSTDRTGALIDEAAAADSRIVPVHLSQLPPGWLGKLNAMAKGIERSSGDWVLFADADVRYGPQALRRAITYAEQHQLDFLTVMPQTDSAGFLADTIFAGTGLVMALTSRPWRVRDMTTTDVFGVGAFLLVRRSAYLRSPGFEWLKLEVADDMGLCLMIKRAGGRCDVVNGRGMISLRWYESFREMTEKMQKNFYAIMGRFSLARSVAMAAGCVAFALSPWLALLPQAPAPLGWLTLASQSALVVGTLLFSRWSGRDPLYPALFPNVALLLLAFMSVRAGVLGRRMGGITWRGVRYDAALLRSQQRFRL
ncbi:MAG: glycosyltransferase [Archangium sp.]|nr:glycosyltransferase [Archangium sp.]